jgi:hypothetical protein
MDHGRPDSATLLAWLQRATPAARCGEVIPSGGQAGGIEMAASALIEHQIPGRVRLKVGSKRGEIGFFESVVEVMSKHPGVEELRADPLTGSVIIRHSGAIQPILAVASEHQLFAVEERETGTDAFRARTAAQSERQHPGLFDAIAVGLGGLGLLQVTRGQAVGSAAENFWNAYGAHRLLQNPPLTAGFAALGVYQLLRGQLWARRRPSSSMLL